MNNYKEAALKIKENQDIYIISHINPDGDNLGSILGLGLALKKLSKNVHIIKSDDIPDDYLFLPYIDKIEEKYPDNIDLLLILDCSDLDRLGEYKDIVHKSKFIINIDHHISNTSFGHINLIDWDMASTGELVFNLIKELEVDFDEEIATCLYTAISSDTGRFMYENVTWETHEKVAELIRTGMDLSKVNKNLYQRRSLATTRLFIDALSNLNLYKNNNIGITSVTQDMLSEFNAKMDETEGIVSYIRDIDEVEVACLLKEMKEDEIKVSLRSKNYVDVSEICSQFDGGGHKRAAGCTIYANIKSAEEKILAEIEKNIRWYYGQCN